MQRALLAVPAALQLLQAASRHGLRAVVCQQLRSLHRRQGQDFGGRRGRDGGPTPEPEEARAHRAAHARAGQQGNSPCCLAEWRCTGQGRWLPQVPALARLGLSDAACKAAMYRPAIGPARIELYHREAVQTMAAERAEQTVSRPGPHSARYNARELSVTAGGIRGLFQADELATLTADCALLDQLAAGQIGRTDPQMAGLLERIASQANEAIAGGREQAEEARRCLSEPAGLEGLVEVAAWEGPPEEERDLLAALHCLLIGSGPAAVDPEIAGWGDAIAGTVLADPSELPGLMEAAEAVFDGSGDPLIDADSGFGILNTRADMAKAKLKTRAHPASLVGGGDDGAIDIGAITKVRNKATAGLCNWILAQLKISDGRRLLEGKAIAAAIELLRFELGAPPARFSLS